MKPDSVVLTLLLIIAAVRVGSTGRVFSAVVDEPTHIAAGYDWLVLHSARFDPAHPPLARAICALPLTVGPKPLQRGLVQRGNDLLYQSGNYARTLAHVRRGNIVWLLLAMGCVWWWGRRFSIGVAILATAMLASLPPILGHAGLATTDMAVAAALPLALIALELWLERPAAARAAMLGLAIGIGVLTKFSFLLFFPVAALAYIRRARPRGAAIVAGVAAFIVAAGYWFDLGAFIDGINMLRAHNSEGHLAYLLGRTSETGWWYYFPVVFFFKTPIAFMALGAAGAAAAWREYRAVVVVPLLLMLAVLPSHINIGIRHILPIYPPLCVVAACGAAALWRHVAGRFVAVALCAWLFIGIAFAHPDYLAWFNEFAGKHPERIAVDSNLDWGQDLLRLERAARERHIDHAAAWVTGSVRLAADELPPFQRRTGWIAVSESALLLTPQGRSGGYRWLDAYAYERIGKSIRLYHIPN